LWRGKGGEDDGGCVRCLFVAGMVASMGVRLV
jgi:hypothetical protein